MRNSILGAIVSESAAADAQKLGKTDLVSATIVDDPDPPSYLPMREPLPPRVPDLCPDDARDTPHNPETCRDPACDCFPF